MGTEQNVSGIAGAGAQALMVPAVFQGMRREGKTIDLAETMT